jgi:gamma-glutamyltranspeptidase
VATAYPHATQAAQEILEAGGNAIDAAVAAAWSLSVCEPSGSGLGGQTTMIIYRHDGTTVVIDGHSRAPAKASLERIRRPPSGSRNTSTALCRRSEPSRRPFTWPRTVIRSAVCNADRSDRA